jgi:guanyl-specific ribonuclease Sa
MVVEIYVSAKLQIKEKAMSKKNLNRAQRMTVDEIATVAAAGVARALAARQTAAVELSAEELAQVDGGVGLVNPIIYGGPFFSSALATQPGNPAQLGSLAQPGNLAQLTLGLR